MHNLPLTGQSLAALHALQGSSPGRIRGLKTTHKTDDKVIMAGLAWYRNQTRFRVAGRGEPAEG